MISATLTETLFESFPQEQLDQVGHEESEDLLDDLNYLAIDQNIDRVISEDAYHHALQTFRSECKQYLRQIDATLQLPYPLPATKLCQEEIDLLNRFTSLDNEFQLPSLNQIYKNPLLRRIWSYRLRILDFSIHELEQDGELAIAQLRKWLGKTKFSVATVIKLTGDVSQLTTELVKKNVIAGTEYHHIVYFNSLTKKKPANFSNSRQTFETYYQTEIRATPTNIQRFEATFTRKKKIEAYLEKPGNAAFNRFMIRLVQIQLWMLGTSDIKLDDDLEELNPDHIRDTWWLAHQVREQLELSQLLFRRNKIWMLNVRTLLERFIPTVLRENRKNEANTISGQLLEVIETGEGSTADQQEAYGEIKAQLEAPATSTKTRKKKYRGANKIWGAIKWVFQKAGKLLKNIINAIKAFFQKIKDSIRRIWEEIRSTITAIREGLDFLFGRRIVHTESADGSQSVTTDFDHNFDSITQISGEVNEELLQQHQLRCQQKLASSTTTLASLRKIFLVIVDIIKMSNPLGWIQLGFKLVKALGKQLLSSLSFSS
ncbi:MAG: hypothetical protein ACPGJS_22890 [Flammeovirgaceae bacterium]